MNYNKFQKYIIGQQPRLKFKKQCLKSKNIIFESQQIQIGCKVHNIYDFYSSNNYLQIDRPIDHFKLDFKTTNNMELFVQQKIRNIKERTQYKERIIAHCNNPEEQILILVDFQSAIVTLKSIPLPITLHHFCMYSQNQTLPPSIQTETDLQTFLQHKYEYTEQTEIKINSNTFKKGFKNEIQKYFGNLLKICDGVYMGIFTIRNLTHEFGIIFKCYQNKLILSLSSDQYALFDSLFANYKFLFQ